MTSGNLIIDAAFIVLLSLVPALVVYFLLSASFKHVTSDLAVKNRLLVELKKSQDQSIKDSIGMGQRMLRLEKRLKKQIESSAAESIEEQSFSYSQANQMIQQGADVDTIAATCGISHSEAHLMQRLCSEGLVEV